MTRPRLTSIYQSVWTSLFSNQKLYNLWWPFSRCFCVFIDRLRDVTETSSDDICLRPQMFHMIVLYTSVVTISLISLIKVQGDLATQQTLELKRCTSDIDISALWYCSQIVLYLKLTHNVFSSFRDCYKLEQKWPIPKKHNLFKMSRTLIENRHF